MSKIFRLFLIPIVVTIMASYLIASDSFLNSLVTDEGFGHLLTLNDVPTSASSTFVSATGAVISTSSLVSGGTTFVYGVNGTSNQFTQITFPRNIICQVDFLNGVATTTVTGNLVVSGLNARGLSTTETIPISTKTATVTGIGNEAWSRIDSFAFSSMAISGANGGGQVLGPVSTCTIHIGTGEKLGLGEDVRASTDVYKVTINFVDASTVAYQLNGVNPTYDTINTSLYSGIANASRDFWIWLRSFVSH